MRTRIVICTCAVALMLGTVSSGAEAADRSEVVSEDPNAPSSKTPGTQKPADPHNGEQAVQAIPLVEVPQRAEATGTEINELLPKEAFRQTLERIGSELDRSLQEVESRLEKTNEVLAGRPNVRNLQVLEAELREMLKRLRPWEEELDSQLAGLRAALERLDTIAAVWKATAELARQEGVSETTVTRIAAVRGEIDKVRSTVVKQLDQVLSVRDRLVDPSSALTASLEQVLNAREARLQEVFRANRPPLWSPKVLRTLRDELKADRQQKFLQGFQATGQYAREQVSNFGLQLVLFVALVLGLRALRDRARAQAEDDYDLHDAKEVFEFPWAMALLIALILTTPLHPGAPRGAGLIPTILTVVAASWIGRRFLIPSMTFVVWGIMIFYMVDRARDLLDATPTLERFVFLVEMIGALGFLFWILRPNRIAEIPVQLRGNRFVRLLFAAMRVAAVILSLAIIADLAGWSNLASVLGNGVLRSAFLGFFAFVILKVFQSLANFALILWPLRLLRSISKHRLLIRRRLERVLSVLAVGLWITGVFGQIGLLSPAKVAVGRVLDVGVSVGALSVSVGAVIAFALTIWLSFLLARLVVFVLQEEVFTRVRTGRGVPYAISGLLRYTLIFIGFLVGLAAAGVELTKLTVIAGGLGVGIGFGLQNVVNNFVSGLILLFERPIKVGDTVQQSDVWGEIKHIGIRASVIRTFDGAEIIVPNGMLVSDKVTNWTLSDKRRRVEVNVGVEYGTPAQRVIDLLIGVAKANPKVVNDPEPRAFFVNFGDNALEFKLWVWSELTDAGYSIRSELAVGVQEALERAGIGVPFPQRDLHIKSDVPMKISKDNLHPVVKDSLEDASDKGSEAH